MTDALVVVGHVRRAHGIKGEVLVQPETDRPESVLAPDRTLMLRDGGRDGRAELVVRSVRPHKGGWLIRFEGIEGRSAAEALAGRELLLTAEELEPLDDDEVFIHDLIGLDVVSVDGETIGVVRQVFVADPADLLEVRLPDRDVLVPFSAQIVREVDLDARRVVIEPPEGLFDI